MDSFTNMFEFHPPCPSEWLHAGVLYGVGGAAVVVGFLLLFWGHRPLLYRGFMVLVGAAAAMLLAPDLHDRIGAEGRVSIHVTQGVLVFALAVIGLVTARGTWALVAMLIAGLAAAAGLLAWLVPAAVTLPSNLAEPTIPAWQWLVAFYDHLMKQMQAAQGGHTAIVYLGVGAIGGIVLIMALAWPKGMGAVVVPIIASAVLIAGALLLAGRFKPDWWEAAFVHLLYILIALGVLWLLGLIFQARGVARMKEASAGGGD